MIEFIIGVAVGAAFSNFWIMLWGMAKTWVQSITNKTPPPSA